MEGVSSASGKVVTFSVNVSHHGKVFRTETVWRSRDGMGLGLMSYGLGMSYWAKTLNNPT